MAIYTYIAIGSDGEFSTSLPKDRILNILKACPECIEDNRHWFKNKDGLPWFRINLQLCDKDGNYPAGLMQNGDTANKVEIIGLDKGDEATYEFLQTLAQRLAETLNWFVVSDDTDPQ